MSLSTVLPPELQAIEAEILTMRALKGQISLKCVLSCLILTR